MDSFKARTTLNVGEAQYEILSLEALKPLNVGRLPFSLKILLENLLRFEDGVNVTKNDIDALLKWHPKAPPKAGTHNYPRATPGTDAPARADNRG